jgi:hypothetical protein
MNLTYLHNFIYNLESKNNYILIPQHISHYAFYSAQTILFTSILGFYLKYTLMASLMILLYLSTLLHWYKVTYSSLIKIVDIIIAKTCFLLVTFRESKRFNKYRKLWFYALYTSLFAFTINEILLYYNKNSPNMQYIYIRSTIIHMIFIHFLPCLTWCYCAISSYKLNF